MFLKVLEKNHRAIFLLKELFSFSRSDIFPSKEVTYSFFFFRDKLALSLFLIMRCCRLMALRSMEFWCLAPGVRAGARGARGEVAAGGDMAGRVARGAAPGDSRGVCRAV